MCLYTGFDLMIIVLKGLCFSFGLPVMQAKMTALDTFD